MDSTVPTWLNKEFIRNALQGGKDSSKPIFVKDFKVDKPIPKGENYICEIFKVDIDYSRSEDEVLDGVVKTSLIIKSPYIGGMTDYFQELGFFEKEVRMYNEYIPKMDQILDVGSPITPKSFYSSRENVIVLEDLNQRCYKMADRRQQLDYAHTIIAMKTLAVFHAVSVRIHQTEPELVEEMGKEVIFGEFSPQGNKDYVNGAFSMMAEECRQIPQLERYTERVLKCIDNLWDRSVEFMKPKSGSFNVLNHGDFWVNNMLFRYDESNKPVDLKIIDLQISRYAEPTSDLIYLLYGSVQDDVRINHLNEILTIYRNELNKNLEKFGLPQRLTESELSSMMEESEFFGLVITIWQYPLLIANPNDMLFEVNEVTSDQFKNVESNPLKGYYKNKQFLDTCIQRFSEFENKGLF